MKKNVSKWLSILSVTTFIVGSVFAANSDIPATGDFTTDLGVNEASYQTNDLSSFTPLNTQISNTCVYTFNNCSLINTCDSNETQVFNNGGFGNAGTITCCKSSNSRNAYGDGSYQICRLAPRPSQSNCAVGSFFNISFSGAGSCCTGRRAIACNSGVTSVTVPDFAIEGPKPEGIWLLSTERDIPTGARTRTKERTTKVIKHDLTKPYCVGETTNWANVIGFGESWAKSVINLDPSDPTICEDQITYDGDSQPRSGGSGCYKYGEVTITNHGESKKFPIIDRLGNQGECTTPPASIDCHAPVIVTSGFELEHRGLQFSPVTPHKTIAIANEKSYRADDGELLLRLNVYDPEADASCGKSGLNWNQIIADPLLGQKRTELVGLMVSNRLLLFDYDLARADVYTAKINRLKNLLTKTRDNLKLHIWKEIETKINDSNSPQKLALKNLKTKSRNLVSKRLNWGVLEEIKVELRKNKFNGNTPVTNVKRQIEPKSLQIVEKYYKDDYPRGINTLVDSFGMGNISGLKPYAQDFPIIETLKSEWDTNIKTSDLTKWIPNWTATLDEEEQTIENLYAEYQKMKGLLGKPLNDQMSSMGYSADRISNLANVLDNVTSGANASARRIDQLLPQVDILNSKLEGVKIAITTYAPNSSACDKVWNSSLGEYEVPQGGACGTFDATSLNDLFLEIQKIEGFSGALISDINQSTGAVAKPIFDFGYYLGVNTSDIEINLDNLTNNEDSYLNSTLKNLYQSVLNKLMLINSANQKIPELEIKESDLETQTRTVNSQIAALEAEIDAIANRSAEGSDPQAVKISHVEVGRCSDSTCSGFSKKERYVRLDTQPAADNVYEWNLNEHTFEGENYPIFSQKGLYKVTLRIYDRAGYEALEQKAFIRIHPSFTNKEQTEATLNSDCTRENLYANYSDKCNVTFTTKDSFENTIRVGSLLGLDPLDQDTEAENGYDVLGQKGENYLNGIRLTGATPLLKNGKTIQRDVWNVPADGTKDLEIKAILPSVKVITDDEENPTAGIMATVTKPIELVIHTPKVDKRGRLATQVASDYSDETKYQDFIFEIPSKFKPWVFLRLSDNPNDEDPTDPWEVETDVTSCLYAYSTTDYDQRNLPTNFNAYVLGHTDEGVSLINEDLKVEKLLNYRTISDWKAEKGGSEGKLGQTICTALHPENGQSSLASGFTSRIKYGVEEVGGLAGKRRLIEFPGGNLGLMAGSQCIFSDLCPTCDVNDPTCHPADPCEIWPELCEQPPVTCEVEGTCPTCRDTNSCPCEDSNSCPWNQETPPCEGLTTTQCLCEVVAPGSCINTTYITAGFDVEGAFIADTDEFLYISSANIKEDEATHLGGNNVKDIREEITRNAFKLLRGKSPLNNVDNVLNLNIKNLPEDVTYIEGGNVRIGNPNGLTEINNDVAKTIIIKNGNLIIDGDLRYVNGSKTLGVIMLNTKYEDNPTEGNIFVNDQVQEFVGIYFADGSLTTTKRHGTNMDPDKSVLASDQPGFNEPFFDRNTISQLVNGTLVGEVNNQLILTGTLLTKNTLGGSQLTQPKNPWGKAVTEDEARKYDLHHIRRYSPVYRSAGGSAGIHENEEDCTQLNDTACYDNKHSFIVRIDERVKRSTPPGFQSGN